MKDIYRLAALVYGYPLCLTTTMITPQRLSTIPVLPDSESFSREASRHYESRRRFSTFLVVILAVLGLGGGSAIAVTVPAFEWIPLQVPASPDKAVNFIITGDGYIASQRTRFLADCQELVDGFSSKEPFKTYVSHINFYAAWVVSSEEGVSILNGQQVDTAFKVYHDTTLVGSREGGVYASFDILYPFVKTLPARGFNMLVVNSTKFAAGVAMTPETGVFFRDSMANDMVGVALHEMGHAFGRLSDEYDGGGLISPAINSTVDLNNIPWRSWLEPGWPLPTPDSYRTVENGNKVGAFSVVLAEYNGTTSYKPTFGSIMSGASRNSEFGPVNSEALILAIYAKTGPMISITPESGIIRIAAGQQQDFTPTIWSAPTTIGTAWYVDGNFYASTKTLTLHYGDLSVGTHTLKCVVKDTTAMVRNDPKGLLTNTTTWTVLVGDVPAITSQPISLSVTAGQSASFTVAASGSNLTYQWRKGGQAISGATLSTYSIAAAQVGDSGTYDCVVTNLAGSATSSAATLSVAAGPTPSDGGHGGGATGTWYFVAIGGVWWFRCRKQFRFYRGNRA